MSKWISYKLWMLWVWFGNRVIGYGDLTLHLSKDKETVIGVTFGEYEEAVKEILQ